jgi:predicted Ser/Thr protein kinase
MTFRREGQNLGPYRLIEQIGEGGMASVYKAYQPSMERYVAVKILPPHFADDPQFAERFIREARTIAKLEHQNILPVHDFGEENNITYLVMRYLEGGSLKNVMKQGRLGIEDIDKLFSQTCSALDYAHRQGVIHRDVKPANILIDKEGAVYLTDFGIAKVLKGVSQLTATGAAIGTPTYMAPEQSLAKSVDARSDTYALGVILYEVVVGKVPYDADTPMAVALAHIHEPLPLPRELDPSIPEPIEAVIIKAMAKEPNDRYQTASELAMALREAVQKVSEAEKKPAEATMVDLVTEVWEGQQEIATRVDEAPVMEEPAVEGSDIAETVAEEPIAEEPLVSAPTVKAGAQPTEVAEPAGESGVTPILQELPSFDDVRPRKGFPTKVIAIGLGGVVIVGFILVAALTGLFSGKDAAGVLDTPDSGVAQTSEPERDEPPASVVEESKLEVAREISFPDEVNDFIKDPKATFFDDFEGADPEHWDSTSWGVDVSGGILRVDGNPSRTDLAGYRSTFTLSEGNAVLVKFKSEASSVPVLSYSFQESTSQQIHLMGFDLNCLYMVNREINDGVFLWGNLYLVPNRWYYLLTFKQGSEVYEWIWEPGSTSQVLQGFFPTDANWVQRDLNFGLGSEDGLVEYESMTVFEHGGPTGFEAYREYTGDRIRIYGQDPPTYPANQPFHIRHGWSEGHETFEEFPLDHEHAYVEVEMDGRTLVPDFYDHVAFEDEGDLNWMHSWVFNFPEGLSGEHEFVVRYFYPCQVAVEDELYEGECPDPEVGVEVLTGTHLVVFE